MRLLGMPGLGLFLGGLSCCVALQSNVEVAFAFVNADVDRTPPLPLPAAAAAEASEVETTSRRQRRRRAWRRMLFGGLGKERVAEAVRRHSESPTSTCTDVILSQGPWVAFRCFRDSRTIHELQEKITLLGTKIYVFGHGPVEDLEDQVMSRPVNTQELLAVVIFIMGVGFSIWSLKDIHRFVMLLAQHAVEKQQRRAKAALEETEGGVAAAPAGADKADAPAQDAALQLPSPPQEQERWNVAALVGLTAYRFYTGFLSATWMPYLLAMEGQDLWPEQQSIFMGFAKLIYGVTILLNPVFGRVGDHAVSLSHGTGRRLFVRLGITLAALGIYICVLSARDKMFLSFLSGILIWRLGEAINDVTTEALVPEMVPQDQYHIASGIKASSFLFGGLFGYVLLLVYAGAHYDWLYYAYPIGMFTCALPALYLLDKDHPFPPSQQQKVREEEASEEESFIQSLVTAYSTPIAYKGGFPRACLAVFIFGLGTSPMFFLLLIVRDLVGIRDPVQMQEHFSIGSICFFLSAAVASVAVAMLNPSKREPLPPTPRSEASAPELPEEPAEQPEILRISSTQRVWAGAEMMEQRGRILTVAMCVFGAIILLIPCLGLFSERDSRDRAFYLITVFFGFSFGVSFSMFQDLTWQMLPPQVNFATAMGFNVMSRLAGVGLGNFLCGLILDLSYDVEDGMVVYSIAGYVIMCTFSGFCVLLSAMFATSAIKLAKQVDLDERAKEVCL